MGRHLLKAPNGVIVEWSSVVDAPVGAFTSEDAARVITVTEAGIQARNDAHRGWEDRARRLRDHGTTMMDRGDTWANVIGYNRAGPREAELGQADLLALVTDMARKNDEDSAAWLAQNDVGHAVAAERARIVAIAWEMAGEYEARIAEMMFEFTDSPAIQRARGARDALVALVGRVEGDG